MKLGMKLLAAPLLTAVVVMLSGQINAVLMTRSAKQGQTASKASLEDFKVVQSVQQQLSQVHTGVYRTVALIGSMDDPKINTYYILFLHANFVWGSRLHTSASR